MNIECLLRQPVLATSPYVYLLFGVWHKFEQITDFNHKLCLGHTKRQHTNKQYPLVVWANKPRHPKWTDAKQIVQYDHTATACKYSTHGQQPSPSGTGGDSGQPRKSWRKKSKPTQLFAVTCSQFAKGRRVETTHCRLCPVVCAGWWRLVYEWN